MAQEKEERASGKGNKKKSGAPAPSKEPKVARSLSRRHHKRAPTAIHNAENPFKVARNESRPSYAG